MKSKYFLILILTVMFTASCGSKKRTVSQKENSSQRVSQPRSNGTTQKYADVVQGYIDQYADIAMDEMRLYKIPASITLAQGILESGDGNSSIIRRNSYCLDLTISFRMACREGMATAPRSATSARGLGTTLYHGCYAAADRGRDGAHDLQRGFGGNGIAKTRAGGMVAHVFSTSGGKPVILSERWVAPAQPG